MWQDQHEAYTHQHDIGSGVPTPPPGRHDKMLAQDVVDNGRVCLHPGECRIKEGDTLIHEPYGSGSNKNNLIAERLRGGGSLTALDDIGNSIARETVLTARCGLVEGKLGGTEMIDDHPPLRVGGDRQALASRYQPHLDFLVSTHGHKRVSSAVTLL